MERSEIEKLEKVVNEELHQSLARRAALDDQIQILRDQRAANEQLIGNARAMLKFAGIAKQATADTSPKPRPVESGSAAIPAQPASLAADEPSREPPPPSPSILKESRESLPSNSMSELQRIQQGLPPGSAGSRRRSLEPTPLDASGSADSGASSPL